MSASSASFNDVTLLFFVLFSIYDILSSWQTFSTCRRPIHHWLILSYACIITQRFAHVLGSYLVREESRGSAEQASPDFLLDWRLKQFAPRALATFLLVLALPFFAGLTLVGTFWLYQVYTETPYCVPTSMHLCFSGLWLLVCYAWTLAQVVVGVCGWVLERRLRAAEGNLEELEDPDLLSRWGQVSRLQSYASMPVIGDAAFSKGLTPAQIKSLPGTIRTHERRHGEEGVDCPVCIGAIEPGDAVRQLGCGHIFHRSCVDLWLVRCADCPLCKRKVEVP